MQLSNLTWLQIEKISKETPVLIPIAAVEQHGHHLPLFTDSLILGEIISRVDAEISENVLITPLQWYGNSHHHMDFGGTLSVSPRTYLDMLVSLLENLIAHGFQRLLLINGHGGNDVPGKQATFEVRQKFRHRSDLLLLFSTYWSLGCQPQTSISDLHQSEMGHACEWETSMILRIRPTLVGDYRQAPVVEPGNPFRPASRAWITKDRSSIGHIGWPHLATVEKGESLLSMFANDVGQLVQRMIVWDGKSWEG